MWDTAGLHKFKSIVKSFYRGGHIIAFVYSLDKRETFLEAISLYEEIMQENNHQSITKGIVIANKSDL